MAFASPFAVNPNCPFMNLPAACCHLPAACCLLPSALCPMPSALVTLPYFLIATKLPECAA